MIIAIIAKIGFDYESIIVDYRTIMQSLPARCQRRRGRVWRPWDLGGLQCKRMGENKDERSFAHKGYRWWFSDEKNLKY